MKIWGVYGILPLQKITAEEVLSEPARFEDHPGYLEIHQSLKDALVFDTETGMKFSRDWNLVPSAHNDNYLFDSLEKAEAGQAWLAQRCEMLGQAPWGKPKEHSFLHRMMKSERRREYEVPTLIPGFDARLSRMEPKVEESSFENDPS